MIGLLFNLSVKLSAEMNKIFFIPFRSSAYTVKTASSEAYP